MQGTCHRTDQQRPEVLRGRDGRRPRGSFCPRGSPFLSSPLLSSPVLPCPVLSQPRGGGQNVPGQRPGRAARTQHAHWTAAPEGEVVLVGLSHGDGGFPRSSYHRLSTFPTSLLLSGLDRRWGSSCDFRSGLKMRLVPRGAVPSRVRRGGDVGADTSAIPPLPPPSVPGSLTQ